MTLKPTDLATISERTREHYQRHADDFKAGTKDHDVRQNINALLDAIQGSAPFTILDFGCGPGRDLLTFSTLGHTAIGLDGTAKFVEMARLDTGCQVWQQDFMQLELPDNYFDGIFANAVLFHIPNQELPRILQQLYASLKSGGVLFSSNPRGNNQEGWQGERYGAYHDLETWRRYLIAAGFTELNHYYRPEGLPREQQPWLATVWRK
jgi:SAM-dependent methyltransferase